MAVLALTVLACSSDTPATSTPIVRDSAWVRIFENADAAPDFAWRLSVEPLVEIGGEDAGEDYGLVRVWSAARLPDGRIGW